MVKLKRKPKKYVDLDEFRCWIDIFDNADSQTRARRKVLRKGLVGATNLPGEVCSEKAHSCKADLSAYWTFRIYR
jgi:hypothetical protein